MAGGSLHVVVSGHRPLHFAEAIAEAISAGRAQKSAPFIVRGRVCHDMSATFSYPTAVETIVWTLHHCTFYALRVQRWFRKTILRAPRRLALAMALHPRLGQASLLGALLCSDLLEMVANSSVIA